jgi:hypothetical protein
MAFEPSMNNKLLVISTVSSVLLGGCSSVDPTPRPTNPIVKSACATSAKEETPHQTDPEPDKEEYGLPAPLSTGAICPPDLLNILGHIRDGRFITDAQCNVLRDQSRPKIDRKAFIGAAIDALIDFYKAGRSNECHTISDALFKVWGLASGYSVDDAVITDQTVGDFPLRVWCDFYQRYKT